MAHSRKYQDLTGKRFGRLVAVADAGRSKAGKVLWNVRCDCGTEKAVIGSDMRSGRTVSCGCHSSDVTAKRNWKHGLTFTPEHMAWRSMIARCRYETATGYKNYGGRGVSVCDRWQASFEDFLADVGPRPSRTHSLDRFPDVDGDYEPGNVRWATQAEQAQNKRRTRWVRMCGERRSLAAWCHIYGIPYRTAYDRVKKLGWTPEEAFILQRRRGAA